MAITAAMVKELRDSTGAGMMDAKSALTETNGDMEAAVDWLRTKGLAKAAKKSGRTAAEGLVAVAVDGGKGVAVEVNSETDFVARNDLFQGLVKMTADVAMDVGTDVEAIKAAKVGSITVADAFNDTIAKIGENMTVRRSARFSVAKGTVSAYVHNAVAPELGKIGVLVALHGGGDKAALRELGRKIAMHVAATAPLSLNTDDLDPAAIEKERQVLTEKAKEEGKPEAMIDKIVDGKVDKYYSEIVLLEQKYVKDPDMTIEDYVKSIIGSLGENMAIKRFSRFQIGS